MRFLPIFAVVVLGLLGCSDGNDSEVTEAQDQRDYRTKVYDQVDLLKKEMAEVGEELKSVSDESRDALQERHDDLENAAHDLQNHLQFLGNSTESTWEEWKKEADQKLAEAGNLLK